MKKINMPLKKIFLKDERFRISYYFPLDKLILSIEMKGLINPPLIAFRDKHFILVSGWKRVIACLKLSQTSLPVYLIEEENDLNVFLTAFYENLATREFNILEKVEILSRLKKFGESEKKIVQYYLPLLNIPPTVSHLDSYTAFSEFKPVLKKFIHEKNLPFFLVKLLVEFTPQERALLMPLLSPLGQNKKKEILEDLKEISEKSDIAAEKILASQEITDILKSEKISPVQRADKIRLLLKKKRYPTLSLWEKSFDSLLKKLYLPKGIIVRHSPFFEGEDFSIRFSFGNSEELKNNILKLQELSSEKEFSKIFKFK